MESKQPDLNGVLLGRLATNDIGNLKETVCINMTRAWRKSWNQILRGGVLLLCFGFDLFCFTICASRNAGEESGRHSASVMMLYEVRNTFMTSC